MLSALPSVTPSVLCWSTEILSSHLHNKSGRWFVVHQRRTLLGVCVQQRQHYQLTTASFLTSSSPDFSQTGILYLHELQDVLNFFGLVVFTKHILATHLFLKRIVMVLLCPCSLKQFME